MKTLKTLEKSRSFWVILGISLLFFFLRFPSIFEPYWYGDEGIYEIIGQALHQGRILYTGIWDNKPPMLYIMFALFNGNQESVRALSLAFGLLSTIVFFYFSQNLFKKMAASITATILFALLFGTPFIEGNIANAENFMILPILGAALLIYNSQKIKVLILNTQFSIYFFTGLLLGVAFLYKIVALFDLAAFVVFLVISSLRGERSERRSNLVHQIAALFTVARNDILMVLAGFFIPLTITALYFLFNNSLTNFIQATFFGNIGYVGYGNSFLGIPQGFLIFKLLLVAIVITTIFIKRHMLTKPTIFILIWLSFALFNAFFSQRPYTHYLLTLLPAFCLFIGLIVEITNKKLRFLLLACLITLCVIIKNNFWLSNPKKTALYYQNIVLFITGQKDVQSYRSFFDRKTPRDYELASFITKHTQTSDDIFIWGDSAQIYALSHKLPINKYTVAYHIRQNKQALQDTQQKLMKTQPKYIITLAETPPFPFTVPFYKVRFTNAGATIYERNF